MADGGNSCTEVTSSPMCQVENQDQLSITSVLNFHNDIRYFIKSIYADIKRRKKEMKYRASSLIFKQFY